METIPENINNNSQQEYLNTQFIQYDGYLKTLKEYEINLTNSKLNNFLLGEIKEIEQKSSENKRKMVIKFNEEIKEIEKQKMNNSDPNGLLAMEENFIKNSFERQIRVNEKLLKAFVDKVKSELK
jgi:hypothetical protein